MMERTATILCTIGTRPETIKMAPVIRAFRTARWARCRVLLAAQHRELVDPMLAFFGIEPDIDLDIMRADQSLVELTSRMLPAVHDAIARERPDIVLARGDTTTVFVTALASFYCKIPFAHVEAGLRTGRLTVVQAAVGFDGRGASSAVQVGGRLTMARQRSQTAEVRVRPAASSPDAWRIFEVSDAAWATMLGMNGVSLILIR